MSMSAAVLLALNVVAFWIVILAAVLIGWLILCGVLLAYDAIFYGRRWRESDPGNDPSWDR